MKKLLVMALKNRFDMEKQDATELAKTVEKVFKGRKEVEDMSIDKYVRSLFYELLRERLLIIRREEFKENSKYIRKYYWSFNHDTIKEAAYQKIKGDPYQIYNKIPKEAWLSHLSG